MKPKSATIIRPDGSTESLDHRPKYDEARKIIDGYIEIAHGRDAEGPFQMLVDEDGHQRSLPLNLVATRIYKVSPIVGTAILLRGWKWS